MLVTALLPFLLSLAVFDHCMPPLLVFLLFATLELVTGNFVEAWLYGMHTGISSLALLVTTKAGLNWAFPTAKQLTINSTRWPFDSSPASRSPPASRLEL